MGFLSTLLPLAEYSVMTNVIPRTVIALFFGESLLTISSENGTTAFSLCFLSFENFLITLDGVGDPESLLSGENLDFSGRPLLKFRVKHIQVKLLTE